MSNKKELQLLFLNEPEATLIFQANESRHDYQFKYGALLIDVMIKVMKRFSLSQQSTIELLQAIFDEHQITTELPQQHTFSTILGSKRMQRIVARNRLEKVGKYVVISSKQITTYFRYKSKADEPVVRQITITGHVSKDYEADDNKHINFTIGDYFYRFPINHYRNDKKKHQAPAKTGKACLVAAWLQENKDQVRKIKALLNLDDKDVFNALIPFIHSHIKRPFNWLIEDYYSHLNQFKNKRKLVANAIKNTEKPAFKINEEHGISAHVLPIQYYVQDEDKQVKETQLFLFIRCPDSHAIFLRAIPESTSRYAVNYFGDENSKKKDEFEQTYPPKYSLSIEKKKDVKHQAKYYLQFNVEIDFDGKGNASRQFQTRLNLPTLLTDQDESNLADYDKKNTLAKHFQEKTNQSKVGEKVRITTTPILLAGHVELKPLIISLNVKNKQALTSATVQHYLKEWVTYVNKQFTQFTACDEAWFYGLHPEEFYSEMVCSSDKPE